MRFNQQHLGKEQIQHRLVVANTSGDNFINKLIEGVSLNKIQAEVSVGSKEMLNSYKQCRSFLEEKGLEEAAEYIDFVENRVEIRWIKASDIESAFIVFDRMNDRGENLTVSDKFQVFIVSVNRPR